LGSVACGGVIAHAFFNGYQASAEGVVKSESRVKNRGERLEAVFDDQGKEIEP
jgi:hypothetical protein